MKLLKTIMALLLLMVSLGFVSAQNSPELHKNTEFNQVLVAALTYTSVAGGCGLRERYFDLKSALVQLLERENLSQNLTRQGTLLYSNLEAYIEAGEKEYKDKPYVTCGDALNYIDLIFDLVTSNLGN